MDTALPKLTEIIPLSNFFKKNPWVFTAEK
jgi:hypothetical protein